MNDLLGNDWRLHLPQGAEDNRDSCWRAFFEGCTPPDPQSLPDALEAQPPPPIFPGRLGALRAPDGAHLCKAFDGLTPADVRVMVLGQDPYPEIGQATGRAFEDGSSMSTQTWI